MNIQKNDIVKLNITSMSSDGSGVARLDNMVVFVPNTAPGDYINAKIVKVLKNYAFGRVEEILEPSDCRIKNDCPVFEKCGGCVYRHISYQKETEIKAEQVFHNVKAIGKTPFNEEKPLVNANRIDRYRNKGQYPVSVDSNGNIIAGFFAPRSHRIIPVEDCKLQPKIFSEIIKDCLLFFKENNVPVYDEKTKTGILRHIYLRQGEVSGEIMVCFVVKAKSFINQNTLVSILCKKYPQIKSIVLNINKGENNVILGEKCIIIWGKDTITDEMCSLKAEISPLSFYQVNHDMAESVYYLAGELAELKGNETVLDLYCGAGLIGLSVADKVKKVIGIEIIPDAVKNAKRNAENNNINNAEFFCSDASLVAELIKKGYKFDIAFVDPPRKGCSPDVIDALAISAAKRIIMISCNSATLARDINLLSQKGYVVEKVVPADLFPRTVHCEAVASLKLKI